MRADAGGMCIGGNDDFAKRVLLLLRSGKKRRLEAISGTVPSLLDPPPGCRFAPRCKFASAACTEAVPELRTIEGDHKVACILY